MKQNAFFNLSRLVANSGSDTKPPIESEFLGDLDYTLRKLNSSEPHYYFKQIYKDKNPEYFDTNGKSVNYILVFDLPEPSAEVAYDKCRAVYMTSKNFSDPYSENKCFVCLYSDGKPSRRYKPSCMKCIRNMYYQLTGADLDKQSQKSGDFYGICESGEDRHKRIQAAISKMQSCGVDCEFIDVEQYIKDKNLPLVVESKKEFETKVYDPVNNIIFLCDGVVKYKGQYLIIEIKTESSFKWNKRTAMEPEHRNQAITYSYELGIESVLFIYENRDICTKKSYLFTPTDADKKAMLDKIAECNLFVSIGKVPALPADIDDHICQYCDYKTVCKRDSKNEESKQG